MVKTGLKLAVSLGLTGIFLWAAFKNVDLNVMAQAFKTARPAWLLLSGFFVIASCLPRAWRWQILLKPISKDVSLKSAFWAVLMAYAGNNVFPRAGEVARAAAIKRDHPVSMSAVLATVVVERLLDTLMLLILFGIVLFFARDQIARAFPGLESISFVALPIILLSFVGLGLLSAYGERGLIKVENILMRFAPKPTDRIMGILRAFLQGMGSIHSFEGYVGIFFSTALLNACYLMAMYLPFYSFDFPANHNLDIFDALVVMAIATIGVVIPTPGGTGTYHYFCTQTLFHFYGVPESTALAFATAVHGIAFISFLLLGGPPLLRLMWWKKKSPESAHELSGGN